MLGHAEAQGPAAAEHLPGGPHAAVGMCSRPTGSNRSGH